MRKIQYITVTSVALVTFFLSTQDAFALSCSPNTLTERIGDTTVIFTGEVTKIQPASEDQSEYAEFTVSEYWKGPVNKKMIIGGIRGWNGRENPPVYFEVGKEYIVFAQSYSASSDTKNIPGRLGAIIHCGHTELLSEAEEVLSILGEGKKPTERHGYSFVRDLHEGVTGEDVRELQKYLNLHNFTVASSGFGSSGNETTYFGPATRIALTEFQTAYSVQLGITQGTGYFGPLTRALVNK